LIKSVNNFIDFLQKLLSNENYINFISIIVVATTTYFVTKYNASKPNRIRVKQLQLENVYLPLHRLFLDIPSKTTAENALLYSKKIDDILNQHYVLVFPQLHKLNSSLSNELRANKNYNEILHIMKHQVDTDYELLKKVLGYPSENLYSIFIRMTFKQKAEYLVSCADLILIFGPIFLGPGIMISINPSWALLVSIVFSCLGIHIAFKLSDWVNNLKN